MFEITGKLGLNSSEFNRQLADAHKRADQFAHKMEGVGSKVGNFLSGRLSGAAATIAGAAVGGGVGAIIGQKIGEMEEMLDHLQEKAKEIRRGTLQTGFDAQEYQRITNALEAGGASAESLATGLEHVAEATVKIRNGEEGAEKLAKAMAVLGVSVSDIQKKDFKQIFTQIAEGVQNADLTAERMTAIKEVLGKGGVEMIPGFKLGINGTAANRGTIADADLEKLNELNSKLKESKGFWAEYGNEVGLQFTRLKTWMAEASATPLKAFLGDKREKMASASFFGRTILGWFGLHDRTLDELAKPGSDPTKAHFEAMAQRTAKLKEERALREAAAVKEREEAQKAEEKRQKLREHFTSQKAQFDQQAAADRFSLLSNEEKLRVLKAQEEVLRHMHGRAEVGVLNGDTTGEADRNLSEIEMWQSENKKKQREISEQMNKAGNSDPHLQINDLQRIGAQILFNPSNRKDTALDKNTVRMEKLGTQVEKLTTAMSKTDNGGGGFGGGGDDTFY